jgi:hypothetical protein
MNRVRPLEPDDGDRLREAFPAMREGFLSQKSLTFHARTDHAFVLEDPHSNLLGVTLAQSIWNGIEPELRIGGIWVADGADDGLAVLLDAVVKSAYDAAVYRLRFDADPAQDAVKMLLEATGWTQQPVTVYAARLGSDGGVLRAAPGRNASTP